MTTKQPNFTDRVRFNWGFHDGQSSAEINRPRDVSHHFDSAYAAGYVAGVAAYRLVDERSDSSEPAWVQHQTALEARRAMHRQIPDNRTVRV
jgi:hypothetical protein